MPNMKMASRLLATLLWVAATAVCAADAPPAVKGVNIMDVKPEASEDPGYRGQTNAERHAVQPGNNAPLWRDVGAGATGYSSLPQRQAPEAGNLIQPFVSYPMIGRTNAGEAWRQVRNRWIIPYGGSLLSIVVIALGIFYFTQGRIGHDHGGEPRTIERFTPFERAAHWTNAIAFCILALSGLVMAFGKWVLPAENGSSVYGVIVFGLKTLHNFVGPLFVVSLVVVFLAFVRDNLMGATDLRWLSKGGGMLKDTPMPAPRFNGGEKLVFWVGVVLLGFIVAASGLVLDGVVPGVGALRGEMQWAHMVHSTAAMSMIALFIGHIYIGTIGMRNAYGAMREGWVSPGWASEHHRLWFEDIRSGKVPVRRSRDAKTAGAATPNLGETP